MNYPKPEIQTFVQPPVAQYMYVPEYRFNIKTKKSSNAELEHEFEGLLRGFEQLNNFGRAALAASGTIMGEGTTSSRIGYVPEPYSVIVANTTNEAKEIVLFESYKNRAAPNLGNPHGVIIQGGGANTYFEQMAQTEQRPCFIGKIRVQVISKQKNLRFSDIHTHLRYKTTNANGESFERPIYTPSNPHQMDLSIVEQNFSRRLILDGFSNFKFWLAANSQIAIELYPEA